MAGSGAFQYLRATHLVYVTDTVLKYEHILSFFSYVIIIKHEVLVNYNSVITGEYSP